MARELDWNAVEISTRDGHFEEVWTTGDGQNVIRYLEDPSASAARLVIEGEEATEVMEDIESMLNV